MPKLIAPSILAADFARLGEQIAEVDAAGADWIHVDVMDGRFVPNITMGPLVVEAVRRSTKLPIDVHLMIVEPERYLSAFADAGADRINVHVEVSPHLPRTLAAISELGCQPGIAINPGTSLHAIEESLPYAAQVLVMSVNPGFGAQHFMPRVLPKIRRLRALLDQHQSNALIEIDGGIDITTIDAAAQSGVDVFVAGNAIFTHPQGATAGAAALRQVLLQPTEGGR